MAISCYIFEGTWWSKREIPIILPYFMALANDPENPIKLAHRTFRNADDIKYYISGIGKNERAFVYFACHGDNQQLLPIGKRYPITNEQLLDAISYKKKDAIEFLHFGCCEMISRDYRKYSLKQYQEASGAKWVSGYALAVDWFQSTLLDLALIAELAIPYHERSKKINPKFFVRAKNFISDYEQLIRKLEFSGLYKNSQGVCTMFPKKHG